MREGIIEKMADIYGGLDIGSVSTKLVLLKDDEIYGHYVIPTGGNSRRSGHEILKLGAADKGLLEKDIRVIVSTGYGRYNVDVGKQISEITCQARGVAWLIPDVRVIIDIGGQDFKVIQLDKKGHVKNFAMNDKCAAGTGRYLELMAGVFSVDVKTFGTMGGDEDRAVEISSVCTVFAESEVVSHIAKGTDEKEIIAGVFGAVSQRVFSLAKRYIGGDKWFALTGGVAKNPGVLRALEKISGCSIKVPEEPQITAAIGAAILAKGIMDPQHRHLEGDTSYPTN